MGNSISIEEQREREDYVSKIKMYPCPLLNIGNRIGQTGYIDFITRNEID
jgi:hypothetical protein